MSKEYKIKTIKELEEVVDKRNVKCLKTDLCAWLDLLSDIKEVNKLLEKEVNKLLEKELIVKLSDTFTWIDDGKNDKIINIKIE